LIDYAKLLENGDELLRNLPRVFPDFTEETITFPPTYKFKTKGKTEEMEYSLKRLPAYCDRIILKNNNKKLSIVVNEYRSTISRVSDHLPVCGDYSLGWADDEMEEKPNGPGGVDIRWVAGKRNARILKGVGMPLVTVGVMLVIFMYLFW
jgi:hypothetical protein